MKYTPDEISGASHMYTHPAPPIDAPLSTPFGHHQQTTPDEITDLLVN